MKKLALSIALFLGMYTTVNAQNQGTRSSSVSVPITMKVEAQQHESLAKQQTEAIDKIVGLSDDQKAKIYDLNLSLSKRTEMVQNGDQQNKDALLKEIDANRINMVFQQLTNEQATKYKASLAGR